MIFSFLCTDFQEGYIFWDTNFLQGYYGAILVSKFNNILTTCDISFWCTDFQEGYIFWGTNFLQGYIFGVYKFSEVVEIS